MRAQKIKGSWRKSFLHLREHIDNRVKNVSRNMDGKGHSNEVQVKNEKHVIGNWRKSDPSYKVAKNLAASCSCSSV